MLDCVLKSTSQNLTEFAINCISDLQEISGILLERTGKNREKIPTIPAFLSSLIFLTSSGPGHET